MNCCGDLEFPLYKFVGALNNLVFASGRIRAKRVERSELRHTLPYNWRTKVLGKNVAVNKKNKARRELKQ